jgi:hypothetical protein
MGSRFLTARIAGIAGIIFVIATAVPGFASGQPPDGGDPAAKFLAYYQDNRSGLIAAALLGAFGTIFAIFFFAKVITTMRRAEGGTGTLSVAAILSITMVATMATIGGVLSVATAFRVGSAEHADALTIVTLNDASSITFTFLGVPLAAFFVAEGLLIMGTRQLPAWLGILTLVAAALEALGALAVLGKSGFFSPSGAAGLLFGLLPLAVFVVATSIVMLSRPARFDSVGVAAAA